MWWRVIEKLGFLPHSDYGDKTVTITVFRKRKTLLPRAPTLTSRKGYEPEEEQVCWVEASAEEARTGAAEKVEVQCKVAMTVAEVNEAVLAVGVGVKLSEHDGFAYTCGRVLAVELEFVSHRWLRPWWPGSDNIPVHSGSHVSYKASPDDALGSKAQALARYGRRACQEAQGDKAFWIDFSCLDQRKISPGVAMLPLYAAHCASLAIIDHAEYDERAWTRAERVLFAAFNKPEVVVLGSLGGDKGVLRPHGVLDKTAAGQMGVKELKTILHQQGLDTRGCLEKADLVAMACGCALPRRRVRPGAFGPNSLILKLDDPDPSAGAKLTNKQEAPLLRQLVELSCDRWGLGWRGLGGMYWGSKKGLLAISSLRLGVTEVAVQVFV